MSEANAVDKSPNYDTVEKLARSLFGGQRIEGFPFKEGFPKDKDGDFLIITRDGEKHWATIDLTTQYQADGITWRTKEGQTFHPHIVAAWIRKAAALTPAEQNVRELLSEIVARVNNVAAVDLGVTANACGLQLDAARIETEKRIDQLHVENFCKTFHLRVEQALLKWTESASQRAGRHVLRQHVGLVPVYQVLASECPSWIFDVTHPLKEQGWKVIKHVGNMDETELREHYVYLCIQDPMPVVEAR